MHSALKTLITQAINSIYLPSLCHPDSGLSNIHLCNILTFLLNKYGEITPQALDDNDKFFCNVWDP